MHDAILHCDAWDIRYAIDQHGWLVSLKDVTSFMRYSDVRHYRMRLPVGYRQYYEFDTPSGMQTLAVTHKQGLTYLISISNSKHGIYGEYVMRKLDEAFNVASSCILEDTSLHGR